ncbi:MAG: hypothetical protein ACP6IP_04050 [Candidatus Njordarchaeia archaeon]
MAEFTLFMGAKGEKLTEEDMIRFQEHIGVETMALMYSAMITDVPAYTVTVGDTKKPAEFLRQLLKDYPERIPIFENEVLDGFSISVLSRSFYESNEEIIDRGLIYSMIIGSVLGDWRFNYMRSFLKKTIKQGYKGLISRYTEAKRLKLLFDKFYERVVREPRISLKKIRKELNLSKGEARYFAELVKVKDNFLGTDYYSRIVDDLGILDIF